MSSSINFLYCFDENYTNQAFSSMISFLDNISKKINIIIIYNKPNLKDKIPNCIANHKNLNSLKVHEFKEKNYYFPNLDNNHISEATYYRIFLEKYIEPSIKSLVYVDADTICINDPTIYIQNLLKELIKSSYVISARTEIDKNLIQNYTLFYENDPALPFKRLEIDNLYFNAGVMLIDISKWKKENMTNKLINKLEKLKDKIVTWDQDVINSEINGRYLPLPESLNCFQTDLTDENEKNQLIVHYLGSNKPWFSSGIFMNSSKFYHKNFYKHQNKPYHIVHLWKKQSLVDLLKAITSRKILSLDLPVSFIKEFTLTLFKSNR